MHWTQGIVWLGKVPAGAEGVMRNTILLMLLIAVITGCARDPVVPPSKSVEQPVLRANADVWEGPYHLWSEHTFYINENHDKIDAVPRRQGRLHLNALKFLESYCEDCVKIISIYNNGDGTVDLAVKITHPFPGHPEYTGFDVKGIVMFNGSEVNEETQPGHPLWPQPFRMSWRELGDPELLNADGYTHRWSPWYDSGSDKPIFKYWAGKHSSGTPTANINGFLYFYSNEERHMFECDESVTRTYHISLPPGPVVVGYAVEACWEPPTVTPVVNPATDFPFSANQPEAYHFKFVVNDGNPVTDPDCCNYENWTVHEVRAEIQFWYKNLPGYEWMSPDGAYHIMASSSKFSWNPGGWPIDPDDHCDGPDTWYCISGEHFSQWGPAKYKCIGIIHIYKYKISLDEPMPFPAIDVFEVIVE
jgi:hypothetical protein